MRYRVFTSCRDRRESRSAGIGDFAGRAVHGPDRAGAAGSRSNAEVAGSWVHPCSTGPAAPSIAFDTPPVAPLWTSPPTLTTPAVCPRRGSPRRRPSGPGRIGGAGRSSLREPPQRSMTEQRHAESGESVARTRRGSGQPAGRARTWVVSRNVRVWARTTPSTRRGRPPTPRAPAAPYPRHHARRRDRAWPRRGRATRAGTPTAVRSVEPRRGRAPCRLRGRTPRARRSDRPG